MGLQAAGLKPIDLFEGEKDDYPGTREWALWIWQNMPHAQGLADQHAGRRCADSRGGCRSLADPDLAGPGRRGSRRRTCRTPRGGREAGRTQVAPVAGRPTRQGRDLAGPAGTSGAQAARAAGRTRRPEASCERLRALVPGSATCRFRLAIAAWAGGAVVRDVLPETPSMAAVGPSESHGERYFDAALP